MSATSLAMEIAQIPSPLLAAQIDADVAAWTQTVVAFLAKMERGSGTRRTVEGCARMLWPFLH